MQPTSVLLSTPGPSPSHLLDPLLPLLVGVPPTLNLQLHPLIQKPWDAGVEYDSKILDVAQAEDVGQEAAREEEPDRKKRRVVGVDGDSEVVDDAQAGAMLSLERSLSAIRSLWRSHPTRPTEWLSTQSTFRVKWLAPRDHRASALPSLDAGEATLDLRRWETDLGTVRDMAMRMSAGGVLEESEVGFPVISEERIEQDELLHVVLTNFSNACTFLRVARDVTAPSTAASIISDHRFFMPPRSAFCITDITRMEAVATFGEFTL